MQVERKVITMTVMIIAKVVEKTPSTNGEYKYFMQVFEDYCMNEESDAFYCHPDNFEEMVLKRKYLLVSSEEYDEFVNPLLEEKKRKQEKLEEENRQRENEKFFSSLTEEQSSFIRQYNDVILARRDEFARVVDWHGKRQLHIPLYLEQYCLEILRSLKAARKHLEFVQGFIEDHIDLKGSYDGFKKEWNVYQNGGKNFLLDVYRGPTEASTTREEKFTPADWYLGRGETKVKRIQASDEEYANILLNEAKEALEKIESLLK